MKTFANWMIIMFMGMYWIFRIIVSYTYATGADFIIQPINSNIEIALLFITLICIILVAKRKMFGGILYLISYGGYFGINLYNNIMPIIKGEQVGIANGMTIFTSILAVILALAVVMDLATDKLKRPDDKKTDWFYSNKKLERKTDEREDKNNYRIIDK